MKSHPRIRKTVKWGGAVVTVLLVVAYIGRWGWLGSDHPGFVWSSIALWILALASAISTRSAWRFDALATTSDRIAACRCPKCNYDRSGLAIGAVCPECGTLCP